MYLQLAVRNLSRAKVRSVLAVVGIIIGVTAITSIGIFGENLKKTVLQSFGDIADEVIITPNPKEGYRYIDEKDIEIIRKSPFASNVIPVKVDAFEIAFRGEKRIITVYGLEEHDAEELFKVETGAINLKSGRAVIGKSLAEDLDVRVGDKITINGRIYRISAVLEREGIRFDINPNNAIIISQKDHSAEFTSVIVELRSVEDIEAFKKYISRTINLKEEKIEILEMKSVLESIDKTFARINFFLMAIAGVSLLVAGVSILNIMLMSTIERTKEIGIMRAIGAKKTDIMKIFLLEASILGVSGSLIGAVLSVAGGYVMTRLVLGDVAAFSPTTLIFAAEGIFFGILTAVLSGLYPAWRASNLEPIQALRYE